jgi:hypothetical protein
MKTIDIVISRYNENLEWLSEINEEDRYNIIVYNKGPNDNFMKTTNMTIHNVDNVGRCDHTCLYHIINNYDNLSNITIFLPGSGQMESKMFRVRKTLELIKKHNSAIFLVAHYSHNIKEEFCNLALDWYFAHDEQNRALNPEAWLELSEIRPFGKWYEHYFKDITIHHLAYCFVFSVDSRDILQHPKEYYENLIKQLCKSSNPEVGHYFERAWAAVFYPMNNTIKDWALLSKPRQFIHNNMEDEH